MSKVRVAVQIRPQRCDYADMARILDRVEELGVDIAYTWDHFFPISGDPYGQHLEGWTTLAAFAERSDRILVGTLVSAISYRNPQLLADMARTVDHISGGRAILGIGAGWFRRDYEEYGYDFGTAASRLQDLDAALPLIKKRLAALNPPPIGPLPILVGGVGEKVTLKIVAEHADIWHGFGTPNVARHKCEVLDAWCREVGRNPAEIERAIEVPRHVPDGLASLGDVYHEIGIRQFTIHLDGPKFDDEGINGWLNWRDRKNAMA